MSVNPLQKVLAEADKYKYIFIITEPKTRPEEVTFISVKGSDGLTKCTHGHPWDLMSQEEKTECLDKDLEEYQQERQRRVTVSSPMTPHVNDIDSP